MFKFRGILMVWLATVSAAAFAAEGSSPAVNDAPVADARRFAAVVAVASVTTRDAQGRVYRFRDAADREFQINYDGQGRVTSAKATLRTHVSDISAVAYDEQGRLVGAQLGSGYVLYVSYQQDGSQILRDSKGGSISRRGSLRAGYQVTHVSDPTDRLATTLAGLDALMRLAMPPQ
jgi:YD repeat-containing protein